MVLAVLMHHDAAVADVVQLLAAAVLVASLAAAAVYCGVELVRSWALLGVDLGVWWVCGFYHHHHPS